MNTEMLRNVKNNKNLEFKIHASYYGCTNLIWRAGVLWHSLLYPETAYLEVERSSVQPDLC